MSTSAYREWDLVVLPVRIEARTEAEARLRFLELLRKNDRHIRVVQAEGAA